MEKGEAINSNNGGQNVAINSVNQNHSIPGRTSAGRRVAAPQVGKGNYSEDVRKIPGKFQAAETIAKFDATVSDDSQQKGKRKASVTPFYINCSSKYQRRLEE